MISQTQLDSIGSKYTKPEWFKEILQVVEKFLWRIQMTPMNLTTIIGQKLMKNCSRSSSSIFIPMPPIKKKKCFFIKTSIVKLKILRWWIGGLPIGSTLVTLLLFLLLILFGLKPHIRGKSVNTTRLVLFRFPADWVGPELQKMVEG